MSEEKHYYRVVSYSDGSGYKHGWVIKLYTDEQAERSEWVLLRID